MLALFSIVFNISDSYQLSKENSDLQGALSPTERYLQEFPIDLISNNYDEILQLYLQYNDQLNPNDFLNPIKLYLPFFNTIVANENRNGFFGYHGHSQQFRVFQDILKAVFEEVLHYDIPNDFQFLRIPELCMILPKIKIVFIKCLIEKN